ncbi:hypothetical protein DENIT_10709 [Pseudomonas veronii]|nr:hypothetical protein DENIT_10709 [Pseudomonas veronii]
MPPSKKAAPDTGTALEVRPERLTPTVYIGPVRRVYATQANAPTGCSGFPYWRRMPHRPEESDPKVTV